MKEDSRIIKAFLVLGYISLLLLMLGIGTLLHYNDYSPLSFILAYSTLLGLPFIWMLPHSDLSNFKIKNAVKIGLITVFIVAICHLGYLTENGNKECFLLIFPLAGLGEVTFIGSFLVKRERNLKKIV